MKKPFNAKEFAALVRVLKDIGVHESIVDLVSLVGGQVPRDEDALDRVVAIAASLVDPNQGRPATKREIDSVRPHTNAISDPTYRGSVVAKPTALDAPLKKGDNTGRKEVSRPEKTRKRK